MTDEATWSEDVCTCDHAVSLHAGGEGKCEGCAENVAWAFGANGPRVGCMRYQWNGKPRKRTW